MARVRAIGRLGSLVGSDSEPDLGGIDVAALPRKKKTVMKGATNNRVVKPAQKATGHGESRTARRGTPPRQALADKSNVKAAKPQNKNGRFKFDDDASLDESSDAEVYKPQKKIQMSQAPKPQSRVKSSSMENATHHTSHKPRKGYEVARDEIPETQMTDNVDMVDVSEEEGASGEEVHQQPAPPTASRSKSSEGDAEIASLKRRLREMTEKYEGLEERHRELRDVGVKAAERNYDKLRKQADESSATASKLIAEMKKELEYQQKTSRATEDLRGQLEESEANGTNLLAKVSDLTQSLSDADREIRGLTTKLAASRSAEANLKAPGSAMKGNAARNWTGQSELMHAAHAKEDLYGDLTGLLVQSMKRENDEDVFDCIQTGRNGTLHFKLALGPGEESDRYEDMQFTYKPQLQSDRDGDLMEVLPDYLQGVISFNRSQASKFYSRVIKSLTERKTE